MAQPSNQEEILTCFKSKIQAEPESEPEICNSGSGKHKSEPNEIITVENLKKAEEAEEQKAKQVVTGTKGLNRCTKCRKRVGLSGGFRCRCGMMYCGEHRYSDRHECGYDYKKLGRERIEKDNPLIRAAKVIRI